MTTRFSRNETYWRAVAIQSSGQNTLKFYSRTMWFFYLMRARIHRHTHTPHTIFILWLFKSTSAFVCKQLNCMRSPSIRLLQQTHLKMCEYSEKRERKKKKRSSFLHSLVFRFWFQIIHQTSTFFSVTNLLDYLTISVFIDLCKGNNFFFSKH